MFSLTFLLALFHGTVLSAPQELHIPKDVSGARLIPISLSGFSGEVQRVLKFDLEIAGFTNVSPEVAQFNISGNNNTSLEGRLTDRVTKASLLANRYENGTPRSQAHAFADDIVLKVTGKPGIARTKIAFRGETAGRFEIYISDYDGANAHPVTQDNALVAAPSWVPGGRMLFYTSYKSGFPDIYSHDLSSGQRVTVAKYPGLNTSPKVSPDGKRVAIILSKDGNPELYVCDLGGGNLKRLTQTRDLEACPTWSPDGQFIGVVSKKDGTPALYRVPAGGGAMKRITTTGAGSVTEPDWSPDGKQIALTAQWREFTVCVIPAEGGAVVPLAPGEDPTWAPNSRTIVFTQRRGSRRVLSLLDVPTKQVKTLDQYSGSRSQPGWAK